MVMTNTCKCCFEKSSHHLGVKYYLNCGSFTVQEIVIIRPDVVLFQGKNAPIFCASNGYLHSVKITEGMESEQIIHNYLRLFYDNETGFMCYAVICIHPSARGRSAKKKKIFYNEELPIIAKFIIEHPLVQDKH